MLKQQRVFYADELVFEWRPIFNSCNSSDNGEKVGAERKGEERVTRRKASSWGLGSARPRASARQQCYTGGHSPQHTCLCWLPHGAGVFPFLNPKSLSTFPKHDGGALGKNLLGLVIGKRVFNHK